MDSWKIQAESKLIQKEFNVISSLHLMLAVLACFAALGSAWADPCKDLAPTRGQSGKDVIWIPTPEPLIDKMLTAAKVTAQDRVFDLGAHAGLELLGLVQQTSGIIGHKQIARHDGQGGQLLRAGFCTSGRHVRQRIPVQNRLGIEQIVDLAHSLLKCQITHCFFKLHKCASGVSRFDPCQWHPSIFLSINLLSTVDKLTIV